MSTSPASEPTPDPLAGVVTFTARGEQALDELASRLMADCDSTTESITPLLERCRARRRRRARGQPRR